MELGSSRAKQRFRFTSKYAKLIQFLHLNESPLFLQLNTSAEKWNDLPVQVYETSVHVEETTKILFAKAHYQIETQEAERIAVDNATHFTNKNNDVAPGSSFNGSLCPLVRPSKRHQDAPFSGSNHPTVSQRLRAGLYCLI
jgi:hypothetical protein